ncbi:MAG TPA: hydrolase, partial [Actinomycetota bacterium]|nr:hydrolase [Actinomycetota bacterium]
RGDDVGGIAVHLASRIMSVAEPGETLVSNTVKDLVIGSDLAFEDRGVNLLRGIEGRWQL